MARRLILDTGVLIASERAKAPWGDVLAADDDVALAAVTVAELRTGVELASEGRREAREAFTTDRSARFGDLPGAESIDLS